MVFALRHVGMREFCRLTRICGQVVEKFFVVRDTHLVLVDPKGRESDLLAIAVNKFSGRNFDQARRNSARASAEELPQGQRPDGKEQERKAGRDEQTLLLLFPRLIE